MNSYFGQQYFFCRVHLSKTGLSAIQGSLSQTCEHHNISINGFWEKQWTSFQKLRLDKVRNQGDVPNPNSFERCPASTTRTIYRTVCQQLQLRVFLSTPRSPNIFYVLIKLVNCLILIGLKLGLEASN